MKILFLHGLESKLTPEKQLVLERFGQVFAPDLDYRNDPDVIRNMFHRFSQERIDTVIGSSMGGFTGFYLAQLLRVPVLLFNPALQQRSVNQNIPVEAHNILMAPVHIVLGELDDVVPPAGTLHFLNTNYLQEANLTIHKVADLQHRIPLEIFEQQVIRFFEAIQ